ncbi:hypothetical protein [Micromonospora narathiwatensis]|uniref:Uncharacterized protein n=1 Tax=Micromonospora narathiwatensis TaxID=299146 RepID=A0A1A8ZQJ8_9ACTN|nr:hypothetical protein [Micromonospora narathiwatensis]SBT46394.1 hypothetical protein GA0070621_2598 [Micromonospora narathiwatensis]
MAGERMRMPKRKMFVAGAVVAVLLICVFATVTAVRRGQEQELSVNSYNTSGDPRLLYARVEVHPDFAIVRSDADYEDDRVILHVTARQPTLWWSGDDHAEVRWVRVRLEQPLGDRHVVDAVTGNPVSPPRIARQ